MKPGSLRLRLLAGAALWIALALALAGLVIGYMFVTNVEQSVRADLLLNLNRLIAQLDPTGPVPALSAAMADPRYGTPLSGLYWQVQEIGGQTARSRSLWDHVLTFDAARLTDGQVHFTELAGPGDEHLSAAVRRIRFPMESGTRSYVAMIAENRSILDASIGRFGRDLVVALAALGIALLGAAWLQVRLGLRPLETVHAGVDAVRHGRSDKLHEDVPLEVLPLVAGVNGLLASQEKSMQFARARAADLAHGLKTPLSAVGTIAERLRAKGDAESADALGGLAREMADRIDYQLRLSRLRMRDRTHVYETDLVRTVERTVAVVEKTRDGERLDLVVDSSGAPSVDMEQHDLVELCGVLIENAAKWARSRVSIEIGVLAGSAQVRISDDGPGLTDAQIASLGQRGKRLDEGSKGSGLGIAIAFEIVEMNEGSLVYSRAPDGGLVATLHLPLSSA
ncbi:MAG TPA: HAMP domain-containing sensor histidine kinase [Devosiaceae bacterium]